MKSIAAMLMTLLPWITPGKRGRRFAGGRIALAWRHRVKRALSASLVLCSPVIFGSVGKAEEGGAETSEKISDLMGMSLEQLLEVRVDRVYGASRYEQNVERAPSSVSIITRDEIQKQGHRTLAEALQSTRSVHVTSDRVYSYVGVRGFGRPSDYNSRLLVLVDGHRMNDNIYDSALLGTESVLDVDLVERIEVIRGPSSSIYGDNAFFGVVNIVTRTGAEVDGMEFSGSAGGFDSYGGRVTYGRSFTNGIELLLSGSWSDRRGEERLYYREFDQPENNDGVAEDSDRDSSYRFYAKLSYGDFALSGAFSRREKVIPTASYATIFNDGGESATDRYGFVDLKFSRTLAHELSLEGRVFYDNYEYNGDYPYNTAPPGDPISRLLNRDITFGEWAGANLQLTAPIGEKVKAVVGADVRVDIRRSQVNYDLTPRTVYNDFDNSTWNAGAYAQAEWEIVTNVVFNGGLRVDYYETFGTTVNPRVGLMYHPWKKSTLKLLYGQAFRAPNASEEFYGLGGLDPETIQTFEAIWEQKLSSRVRFTVLGYYYQVHDLISETAGNFENLGRVDALGGEAELSGRFSSGWEARVSYALQRTDDRENDSELSNSPRHLAKAALIAPIYSDAVFAGFELQYTGSALSNNGRPIDGYTVANVTLFSRKLVRNLEVSGTLYNVFDTEYSHAVSTSHLQDSIEQPGRSFRVVLTYKF